VSLRLYVPAVILAAGLQAQPPAAWPQFGGPTRNFVISSTTLATSWQSGSPRQLWSRALGEGHSSIVSDGRALYTMYRPAGLMQMVRRSQEEVVIALDTATGKTVWEHRFPAPTSDMDFSYGAGPHSTPAIAGDLVMAVGSHGQLFALNRRTGRVAWSHDLVKEYGGARFDRGYSPSPLLYKDTIVLPVGGRARSLMAFRVADGTVAWQGGTLGVAPASPMLITVDGEEQIVLFGADAVGGIKPVAGTLLWSHPHRTDYGLNISTPVFGPGNVLFVSSAYSGGSRLLQLQRVGEKTVAKELWFTNRMRVHFGTVARVGERYYGSSGDFGPSFMVAVDAKDGRVAWQNRGLARASFVYADHKFVMIDEQGTLAIAEIHPTGLNVLAKAELLTGEAWTPPTLVGTTLYARDRKNIVAVALGQ
jgi:outer membrane protein assembly factor BamB